MPEDLVRERLCGTPRYDQAWLNAEEQTNKTTTDILERYTHTDMSCSALGVMPHHAASVFDTFPPEITTQCLVSPSSSVVPL